MAHWAALADGAVFSATNPLRLESKSLLQFSEFDGGRETRTPISVVGHGDPRLIRPGHYRLMLSRR